MDSLEPLDALRVGLALLLVLAALPVANAYLAAPDADGDGVRPADARTPGDGDGDAYDGFTAAVIDGVGPGQLAVFDERSRLVYKNESHGLYHDVDPDPPGSAKLTYAASSYDLPDSACDTDRPCIRNVVERLNLSTGEVERLYTYVIPRHGSSQTHDVDRVNESVLLVADIGPPDRVFMVNTTTEKIIWEWRVSEAYEPESGGSYPDDWTHLNDVELLPDGRVMVSLRNQDSVVFVEPGEGIDESWTLGSDDEHSVLYEQHNPDYIPAERGGPAVLVADSENNRVVEYQRVDGEWERTWRWRDAHLQWPRDADRLPNGNTLIADSHGHRILEVSPAGEIVRTREYADGLYDVERLGTGDESDTGWSMRAIRRGTVEGPNGTATPAPGAGSGGEEGTSGSLGDRITLAVTSLVPAIVLHGVLFSLPGWFDAVAAVSLLFGGLVAVAWAGLEGALAVRRNRG